MTVRTPSTQLIGKNSNNRDVTIRCDIDDLPADVEEWIAKAKAEGLPVDAEKTRASGVVVGNHYGFGGLITYLTPLEQVHQVARIINHANSRYPDPDARASFLKLVKDSGVPLDSINLDTVIVEVYPNWQVVAETFGWAPTRFVEDDGFTEVMYAHMDWYGFVTEILERDYPLSAHFETTSGHVGVVVIPS